MKHQSSISSTTVVHDTLLLNSPRLDAPALVWIRAGTIIHPLAVEHGFFSITFHHHLGFVPVALCTPCADPTSAILRFTYSVHLHPQAWYETSTASLPLLPASVPVKRLGQDQSWILIQQKNGEQGFIIRQTEWNTTSVSCSIALVWYFLGISWLCANWLGALYLIAVALGNLPIGGASLVGLAGFVVPIVLLVCARSDRILLFSFGALTMGVIVGAASIVIAER